MYNKKKVYVVPHSHWDREWYFTLEDSNILLGENMSYLIDSLYENKDFSSYTFDGQLSVIEEYLKIYPENKHKISDLIKNKRLFVGPWYTQTDTLVVNKESIIRNLLYGTRIGKSFGHFMKIGYLPDIFGQNQYLPSIFKDFGIEYAILQRGIYTKDLKENLNFKWASPDKKSIKANNIFLGYGPGKFLASDDEYINEKLIPMIEKLEKLNKDCDVLLLPSGGDQVLIKKHWPKVIAELNKKQDKYTFILSNYEDFMKDAWQKDFDNKITGELIACQKSRIHNTIKSQRYDIKKANYNIENKILYILEPLACMAKTLGLNYPSSWLDKMWKYLFDAHAHDSISGCNSDDTNKDIINRLQKVEKIASGLINIIIKQITMAISKNLGKDNISVLFNTNIQELKDNIKIVVFTKNKEFSLKTLQNEQISFDLIKRDYLSGGKQVVVTAEGEKEIELPGYYKNTILINNLCLQPISYTPILIDETKNNLKNILLKVDENYIENDFYKITLQNGNITLFNKIKNETIENILFFEETEDCGDSYDYSPSQDGKILFIKEATLSKVEKSENINKMTINHKASSLFGKDINITTTFTVKTGQNFINVSHNINNNIKNHRIRVILNTNLNSKTSLSDQGFCFIERQNKNKFMDNWKELGFVEAPAPIYALENIVALKQGENIFGAICKGIKEYEVLDNSKIALTLFRSIGLLGKDNLLWRPNRASGINNKIVYTDDAQMLQNMQFEYALSLNEKIEADLFKIMDKFVNRYVHYQKQNLNLFEQRLERFEIPLDLQINENQKCFIKINNKNVMQSVFKESYDKDAYILRLFNPTNEAQTFDIEGFKKLILCNLYEDEIEKIEKNVTIQPKCYITLKIQL